MLLAEVLGRVWAERQVPDLEFAFVTGNGGIMSEECALVFGAEP